MRDDNEKCRYRRMPDPGEVMTMNFEINLADQRVSDADREQRLASPGFGQVFTEHMITMRVDAENGWHDAQLKPYGPLSLDPATAVLHYAQELFEGLKAYRQDRRLDRDVPAPRQRGPLQHPRARGWRCRRCPRRRSSSARTPRRHRPRLGADPGGHSLYLRPFMIATQRRPGVNAPSSAYLFCVIASPAAPTSPVAIKPVSVWLSEDYTRAAPGGTGAAKCGGNYAAAFVAQQQAVDRRLRPGRLARRRRAPLGRGDGRHEPVLRLRLRRRRRGS
jgi:branched-chain amino acid aminotransferase